MPEPDASEAAAPDPRPALRLSRPLRNRLGFGLVVLATVLMAEMSWLRWAHPIIDFGREMYVAWQVHEGSRLYASLAHFYSPLSPLVNSAWLSLFGVSIHGLILGNAIILVATLAALFLLLRRIAGDVSSWAAVLTVVLVLAFGKYQAVGDFGYLTPYAHELTHGLLLSLLALLALGAYFRQPAPGRLAVVGLLLGLVFLTKYEVFAAAFGAVLLGLGAFWWRRGSPGPPREIGAAAGALLLPPAGCLLWLLTYLPASEALLGMLGPYPYLWDPALAGTNFYLGTLGFDAPGRRLAGMATWAFFYAIVTLPLAFLPRKAGQESGLRAMALGIPLAAYLVVGRSLPFRQALYPLPFALAAGLVWASWPGRARRLEEPRQALRVGFLAFSLLMLARVALNPTLSHYALVLAFPGLAIAVVGLFEYLPAALNRIGRRGDLFRLAAIGLVVGFTGSHLRASAQIYESRRFTFGSGADTLRGDETAVVVRAAVTLVERAVPERATLAVFPEGALVNYLTGRRSSSPHVLFEPGYLSSFTESRVLGTLRENPPDWIITFTREVRALDGIGCQVFGQDCARAIGSWLTSNYAPRYVVFAGPRKLFTLLARSAPGEGRPVETIDLLARPSEPSAAR